MKNFEKMLDKVLSLWYNILVNEMEVLIMYFEILGYVGGERHNLGWTDSKHDARDWAYFCMFNRGYDACDVVAEDGEIIAQYKKGQ